MAKKAKSAATAAAARKVVKPAIDKIKVPSGRRKKGHFPPKPRSGVKGRVKEARLPTTGKFRYLPPKNHPPNMPLPKNKQGEYIDRYGNRWRKGPSRTDGDDFEWDVQINPRNLSQIGGLSPDGRHINVSLGGHVTH